MFSTLYVSWLVGGERKKEKLILEKGFSEAYMLREVDCNDLTGFFQVVPSQQVNQAAS